MCRSKRQIWKADLHQIQLFTILAGKYLIYPNGFVTRESTVTKCITGLTPVESMERMREDSLKSPKELGVYINDVQNTAIMQGMAVYAENRFQNMDALHKALYNKDNVAVQAEPPRSVTEKEQSNTRNTDLQNEKSLNITSSSVEFPNIKLPNADNVDKRVIFCEYED